MTEQEKNIIMELRKQGLSFNDIAHKLSISVNTVKSFYRRSSSTNNQGVCAYCGNILMQTKGKRKKRFCTDKCRMLWWNAYRNELNIRDKSIIICCCCGTKFKAYTSAKRKYCSRDCYYKVRFGVNDYVR